MNRKNATLLALITSSLLLTGCSDNADENPDDQNTSARISLNITDAPVDDADAVVVEFSSVTFKTENDEDLVFNLDPPKSINLLALQGLASQPLVENVEIPAGNYSQIRLGVNVVKGVDDSYITINEVDYELQLPSTTGLKLNTPFTVAAGTEGIAVADKNAVYTIDFDLRKSIVKPSAQQQDYKLKPVLRLVQNINTGSISGTVDPTFLTGENCSDENPLLGNAVYIFADINTVPDDVDEIDPDPVTTALVNYDVVSGEYSYEIGFLSEGAFTLAFTCAADLDDENDNSDVVKFDFIENVDVVAGENTDFPILQPVI